MNYISASEYAYPRELSVSFTGHRCIKLPWGRDEQDERCIEFKARLSSEIKRAYSKGAFYFLSGMADGVDTYAAEEVIKFRFFHPAVRLIAVLPQDTRLSRRISRLAESADSVVVISDELDKERFRKRNMFLVEHSSLLIAGFGGEYRSGTGMTMGFAKRAGVEIVTIELGEKPSEQLKFST